jgi:transcriptional regulator with XRE-family HTH domain
MLPWPYGKEEHSGARDQAASAGGGVYALTLRRFAELVEISAPHQSDIEHNRRRPSQEVLRRMVTQLRRHVEVNLESLEKLDTRIDRETQEWVAETPGVGEMLREVRKQGLNPLDVLRRLEEQRREEEGKDR